MDSLRAPSAAPSVPSFDKNDRGSGLRAGGAGPGLKLQPGEGLNYQSVPISDEPAGGQCLAPDDWASALSGPFRFTAQKGDTVWKYTGGNLDQIGAFKRLNGLKDADAIVAGRQYLMPDTVTDADRAAGQAQARLWGQKAEAQRASSSRTSGWYDSDYVSFVDGPGSFSAGLAQSPSLLGPTVPSKAEAIAQRNFDLRQNDGVSDRVNDLLRSADLATGRTAINQVQQHLTDNLGGVSGADKGALLNGITKLIARGVTEGRSWVDDSIYTGVMGAAGAGMVPRFNVNSAAPGPKMSSTPEIQPRTWNVDDEMVTNAGTGGLGATGKGTPSKIGPTANDLGPHVNNFENGIFANRQLSGEEVLYKYHGVSNRNGRTHNYVTDKLYTSEAALRNDLAILDEWGITINRVTAFKPAKGTWISEGIAAPQTGKFTGEFRPGGGYQGLIDIKNLPKSSVVRTDKLPLGW